MTPCQKCKAERARLRAALLEAAVALDEYVAAAGGAPAPSLDDTKRLVARLLDALQTHG